MKIYSQNPFRKAGLLTLLFFALALTLTTAQAANNSMTVVYKSSLDYHKPSLVLDSKGNPVIAFAEDELSEEHVGLIHCDDPNCEGGGENVSTPYPGEVRGLGLVLDIKDNPVIVYTTPAFPGPGYNMILIHCNDLYCLGNNEAYNYPDPSDNVGQPSLSLALDALGYPVISYVESAHLKLVHCNDPDCEGGDENISSVDVNDSVGFYSSLALDKHGYPVIGYTDIKNNILKLAHCNDPNCEGGDEHIISLSHGDAIIGMELSLLLDGNGYPVLSYRETSQEFTLMHCNDPNCEGGDENTTSYPGRIAFDMDSNGFPVISYNDASDPDARVTVIHCNDPNCEGGDENITIVEESDTGTGSLYLSMVLDGNGYPVISYVDSGFITKDELKLLHCVNPNCAPNQPPDCSTAVPSQAHIFIIDHAFVPIDIVGVTDPDGDNVTIKILGIYQDEPVTSPGDPTQPDGMGVGTSTAQVRAEFSNPNGRVYSIVFRAKDGFGGKCTRVVKVYAPDIAIEDQRFYDSTESP